MISIVSNCGVYTTFPVLCGSVYSLSGTTWWCVYYFSSAMQRCVYYFFGTEVVYTTFPVLCGSVYYFFGTMRQCIYSLFGTMVVRILLFRYYAAVCIFLIRYYVVCILLFQYYDAHFSCFRSPSWTGCACY